MYSCMPELTVSGDSVEQLDEFTTELRRAEKMANSDLIDEFEKVILVKNKLKDLTQNGGSVSRKEIENELDMDSAYYPLQLLQDCGVAKSGGQGGNWSYTGN